MEEFQKYNNVRKTTRESKLPRKLDIFEINFPKALIVEVVENREIMPKNFKEALKIKEWKKAMDEEYNSMP